MKSVRKKDFRLEDLDKELSIISPESLIIVEGTTDVSALRSMGIDSSIFAICGLPLYVVVEKAVSLNRRVIILTDLDIEGTKIFRYLYHNLTRLGVKVDMRFRKYLINALSVRTIEELGNHYRNLNDAKNLRFDI